MISRKIFSACFLAGLLASGGLIGQETFSIVAVDTNTMEVGSAGASCIAGSVIISDVHPAVGAIHTQAFYIGANQFYASSLMATGHSPQQIIDSVTTNDTQGNPAIRQYGVVDFHNGGSRSAAFTGSNAFSFANHITGSNYAIQGNILIGPEILDSMEARFLRTPGLLCHKLMAAMQGANVPGADTRCLSDSTSSISAFLRIAKPGDNPDSLWLDLNVHATPAGQEPIDSLQRLFDDWKGPDTSVAGLKPVVQTSGMCNVFPNPSSGNGLFLLNYQLEKAGYELRIFNLNGELVDVFQTTGPRFLLSKKMLKPGAYVYNITYRSNQTCFGKLVVR